jgi:hypothetical protein
MSASCLQISPGAEGDGTEASARSPQCARHAPRSRIHAGRHTVPRKQIIRMSLDFVDQQDGEYLSVEQLATAAGVSERTLRVAATLWPSSSEIPESENAPPGSESAQSRRSFSVTVTWTAIQFGIWELARFARDYYFLFGELPSETLNHVHAARVKMTRIAAPRRALVESNRHT